MPSESPRIERASHDAIPRAPEASAAPEARREPGRAAAALAALRVAVEFLTRVPLGGALATPDARRASLVFFPVVGALLGALLAGVDGAARLLLPPTLCSVAVVAAWVGLSGALHLDGLCDTFDALMSGRDREGALQVLRDPRAGTAGVVAVSLVLWTKLAALGALSAELRPRALLLAAALGRAWLLPALALPPARPDGLAQAFRGPRVRGQAALALGGVAALCWLLCGGAGLLAAALSAAPVLWVLRAAWRRFGGTTGDVCGAAAELAEAIFLAALCAAEFTARGGVAQ